jgi:hypothetical protein
MNREDRQKYDYLDEHLPYLMKMMRYDLGKIGQELFYLEWNSHFQSFSVSARGLANFLSNSDRGNFRASDFVQGFRARKGDLSGPLRKLDEQVFHLSKRRPREAVDKFHTENAAEVSKWIEENMLKFLQELQELSPEDRKHWNESKADPNADIDSHVSTGPTLPGPPPPQSASSSITFSGTQNQTSSVAPFHIIDRGAESKDKNSRSSP